MATLGDLKARIISETLRDDLADDLAAQLSNTINKAIDTFANEPFWFNETRANSTMVIGAQMQPIPLGWRKIEDLFAVIGAVRYGMRLRQLGEIESLYSVPMVGQPTDYAVLGENVYLWPTPNTAYPMIWNLISDVIPPLVFDTDANAWTNQGQDLICAQSKLRLYRDYLSANLQDPRIIAAKNQVDEAYENLRSESTRKVTTGRVMAGW
jgi:hypothetical protein